MNSPYQTLYNGLQIGDQWGDFSLGFDENGLPQITRRDGAYIHLSDMAQALRVRLKGFGKKQPLARALGSFGDHTPIVDLSAGWGVDSICIASLGHSVISIEQHPLISFFGTCLKLQIQDLLKIKLSIENINAESSKWILENGSTAMIYYFDPLYPDEGRSGERRKEISFIYELTKQMNVGAPVVESIQKKSYRRFVVKRAPKDEPLIPNPRHAFGSKLVRFDVHFPN